MDLPGDSAPQTGELHLPRHMAQNQHWRALLVDDDQDDYVLTREMLADVKRNAFALEWAPNYQRGLAALNQNSYDVILVDYDLGSLTGVDWIRQAISSGCTAPIIMITGRGNYEVDLEAMEAGAVDYLTKSDLNASFLERAIRYAIERKQTEALLRQARDVLERRVQTRTQELTHLNQTLQAEINERRQVEQALRAREEVLNRVLEILPVGVWLTDADGVIQHGNRVGQQIWAGARFVGVEQYGEYKGWWLANGQVIQPDEWAIARAVRHGEVSINEEIEIECFDGSHKIILNSAMPIFNPEQQIMGAVIVNQDITQRKQAEEHLQRMNALLENIFANVNLAIAYLNCDLSFIRVNRQYANIWRQPESFFVGKSLFQVGDVCIQEDLLLETLSARQPYTISCRPQDVPDSPGGVRYWDWNFQPVIGPSGELTGVVVSLEASSDQAASPARSLPLTQVPDLDERAVEALEALSYFDSSGAVEPLAPEVQDALYYTRRQLYTILELLPVGVWLADAQGKILYGNLVGEQIWAGGPRVGVDEFHQYKAWWVETGEMLQPHEWAVARAVTHGETSINELLEIECFNGSHKIIVNSAVPIYTHQNKLLGVVVVNDDITDIRTAQAALHGSEQRYRSLFESMDEGCGLWERAADEASFELVDVNPALERILGLPRLSLLERQPDPTQPFPGASSDWVERLQRVYRTGRPEHYEYFNSLCRKHLENYFFRPGEGLCAVLINDITGRKQAEAALEQYAARLERSNKDLEDFAFVASHDMKEPLRKIIVFGERLKQSQAVKLGTDGRDYVDRMQNAAQRLQAMIDHLLAYARIPIHGQPFDGVDLQQVVKDVLVDLDLLLEQTGGEVQVHELPLVLADSQQMRQLFLNLIGNALKFHRPGVAPVIQISSAPAGEAHPGQVEITVSDNGIGIDPAFVGQVFQPFRRLHGRSEYEGSGMGLAICRRIVERHEGHIQALPADPVGTRFVFTLPRVPEE